MTAATLNDVVAAITAQTAVLESLNELLKTLARTAGITSFTIDEDLIQ
jgi:hypothetical protein